MNEKKSKVIKEAKELFSKYGYKKVSVDEIAKKSGVTKKTIYNYFKDKDELLKYFIFEELENMKNIIDKIDEKQVPLAEKIHEMIYTLFDYKQKNRLLVAIAREAEDILSPSARECSNIINDCIRNTIRERLEKAINDGELKQCDIDVMTFIIYKIYVSVVFEWDLDDKPMDKDKLAGILITILKNWMV